MVLLTAGGLISATAFAITLNFSATLFNGTCSLNLDKSTLPLGDVALAELRPAQLLIAQPFTLSISDCIGTGNSGLTPVVAIAGPGVSQDNRWLFRNAGSANGAGIMVIKSDSLPTHSQQEIENGTTVPLAAAGKVPVAQSHTFYAGVSCMSTTRCTDVGTGAITASLMFIFAYQ
ncbi:type 1 fimbrial protein [Serratia fonticola]|uniref:fimbrial protein n=1 Tax=Serratia fonticola TaxID=47917 RepID=UPI0015C61C4F|nr:type 1 fimbrial protein [Serratia fonticola]MBC3382204.1 type 1 fimbrial protein [Serratia fonticola]NYA41403.1 type 1 fimbrial protein [Serratia fonticola]